MTSLHDPGTGSNQTAVSEAFRDSGRLGRDSATYESIHGINYVNPGVSPAPANTDSTGYTFFTKPVLNLTYDNISRIRKLEFLGNLDPFSMGNAIKCMLSPKIISGDTGNGQRTFAKHMPYDRSKRNIRSKFEDDYSCFISLLSNQLISLSGWPDTTLDTWTSAEGIAKEVVSYVDGRADNYGSFDLTAEFRNQRGDPINAIFQGWTNYMSGVAIGRINPYYEMIVEREVDYQTRIYRLVMDDTNTYVSKIAATGASFPFATPDGASFNFNSETVFNEANKTISVPFRSVGAIINDPILMKEFNKTVEMFNIYMHSSLRDSQMVALKGNKAHLKPFFKGMCYPRIEMDNEFVLYVRKDDFERETRAQDLTFTVPADENNL